MDIIKVFGSNLKKYRKRKGFSQEKFAEKCSLHRTYISDIERFKRSISLENIQRIADALEIETYELFLEEGKIMEHRDRSEGWQHAKLSGHKNEELVKKLLESDELYERNFLKRITCENKEIESISIGGLHEKDVESIIPGARKTKSKTDLKIFYTDGTQTNISIKKSLGGQVYFVRAELFIECFEIHFNKKIPKDVKRAINLFWAAADDAVDIIEKYKKFDSEKNYKLQIRHKSLNATILKAYDEKLYNSLLNWFIENSYEIAFLSFAAGAAKNQKEWSDYIWYKKTH